MPDAFGELTRDEEIAEYGYLAVITNDVLDWIDSIFHF